MSDSIMPKAKRPYDWPRPDREVPDLGDHAREEGEALQKAFDKYESSQPEPQRGLRGRELFHVGRQSDDHTPVEKEKPQRRLTVEEIAELMKPSDEPEPVHPELMEFAKAVDKLWGDEQRRADLKNALDDYTAQQQGAGPQFEKTDMRPLMDKVRNILDNAPPYENSSGWSFSGGTLVHNSPPIYVDMGEPDEDTQKLPADREPKSLPAPKDSFTAAEFEDLSELVTRMQEDMVGELPVSDVDFTREEMIKTWKQTGVPDKAIEKALALYDRRKTAAITPRHDNSDVILEVQGVGSFSPSAYRAYLSEKVVGPVGTIVSGAGSLATLGLLQYLGMPDYVSWPAACAVAGSGRFATRQVWNRFTSVMDWAEAKLAKKDAQLESRVQHPALPGKVSDISVGDYVVVHDPKLGRIITRVHAVDGSDTFTGEFHLCNRFLYSRSGFRGRRSDRRKVNFRGKSYGDSTRYRVEIPFSYVGSILEKGERLTKNGLRKHSLGRLVYVEYTKSEENCAGLVIGNETDMIYLSQQLAGRRMSLPAKIDTVVEAGILVPRRSE